MLENIYKGEVATTGFDAESFFIKGEKSDFVESHRAAINMYTGDKSGSAGGGAGGGSSVLERPGSGGNTLEREFGGGDNNGNGGIGGSGGGGPDGEGGSSDSGGPKTMSNNQKYALKGMVAKQTLIANMAPFEFHALQENPLKEMSFIQAIRGVMDAEDFPF